MNARLETSFAHYGALTELVDYVNDRLMQSVARGKAEPGLSVRCGHLRLAPDRIEAWVGPFRLASSALPLKPVATDEPLAWWRHVNVTSASGNAVAADALIRLQTSEEAAVAMDRLYRLLHMLNHLAVARGDESLWVPLSQRHLLAVEGGHGGFFEEVLLACGMGPERLVMLVNAQATGEADWSHVATACENYRARGFGIAIHAGERAADLEHRILHELQPDWLAAPAGLVAAVRALAPAIPVVALGGFETGLQPGDRYAAKWGAVPRFAA